MCVSTVRNERRKASTLQALGDAKTSSEVLRLRTYSAMENANTCYGDRRRQGDGGLPTQTIALLGIKLCSLAKLEIPAILLCGEIEI